MSGIAGRVHIVCYEDLDGWILGKIACRLHQELLAVGQAATLGRVPDPHAELNHHIIYYDYAERSPTLETVMITHIDVAAELAKVERQLVQLGVEMGICMSRDALERLVKRGIPRSRLCYVSPAHDGVMRPRKLLVGLTTRLYPDGRKREDWLVALALDLSPEEFKFAIMGAGWKAIVDQLGRLGFEVEHHEAFDAERYRLLVPSLDYYLYLGEDEGSLGFLDAVAAGVPTIVTPQGFHLDVPEGITHAFRDFEELRRVFAEIAFVRRRRVEAAAVLDWSRYARGHLRIWEYLIERRAGRCPVPAMLEELAGLGVLIEPQ